jgi:hypothetical protein
MRHSPARLWGFIHRRAAPGAGSRGFGSILSRVDESTLALTQSDPCLSTGWWRVLWPTFGTAVAIV